MKPFKNLVAVFFVAALLLSIPAANAEEGGGKEGGEKENLHAKVDAIVVNLQGPNRQYVQVEMMLRLAKPELADRVKIYMPAIRHKMILLLSSKDPEQLGPTEGKLKLVKESKIAINQALERTDKEGVTDVLFTSFIIQ